MNFSRDLIFDLGFNRGEDALFYMRKGFRVVAVEANPSLVKEACQNSFFNFMQSGRLNLIEAAISDKNGTATFFENLDNDHWSSLLRGNGTRHKTKFREYEVKCLRIGSLIAEYGCPYYLKIDVEGADRLVLEDLLHESSRPVFVSVEEYGVAVFDDLSALGYDRFQIISQNTKHLNQKPPSPAHEGQYIEHNFGSHDSGLFGLELPDAWLVSAEARKKYLAEVRAESGEFLASNDWFDIHATKSVTLASTLLRPSRGGPVGISGEVGRGGPGTVGL